MKITRILIGVIVLATGLSLVLQVDSSNAVANPHIVGTKCPKAGTSRTIKGVRFSCARSGKTLKWVRISSTGSRPIPTSSATSTTAATTTTVATTSTTTIATTSTTTIATTSTTTKDVTTTTVASKPCRTAAQITSRLPNDLQKREWEAVVAKLQPLLAAADSTGRTTAAIDTFDDTQTGILNYGRYYPMSYPLAIEETQRGRCAYFGLVFGLMVSFTGSDKSDDAAKAGIQAATKALLQESLAKYTKVDGYDVDVILIEPVLDYCPGRAILGLRTQCPWNDYGYLYFRTAALTSGQVATTAATDIFSLSVSGATFPPRPFNQIVGIGPSTQAVETGSVRKLVPAANKTHQAYTYVEFSTTQLELGQTIAVDSALAVNSISVDTVGHVSIVDGRPASGVGAGVSATIQTRIYRYNGSGDIPVATRRSDFLLQVDATQAVLFPHYSSATLNLPSGTTLSPGKYLITFTVSGWNPVGSYIRIASFAEGSSGQTDVYAPGKAYRACNLRERIGYRMTDNPQVASIGDESVGTNCNLFYPEVSKGENPARGAQHTWVWSDIAMTLNAP